MAWWIPVAISAASTVANASSKTSQNKSQRSWNTYNVNMQYTTDMNNIATQNAIAGVNASMALAAGQINASVALKTSKLNAQIIGATALYNDALMEEEEKVMWDAMELDLELMENERAVERGAILADQAASGVVMGQDSHADVITDQKTQEALDAFVVRHNADISAAKISNARAKGLWEADMAIKKTIYDGQMSAWSSTANAGLKAAGIAATAKISALAGTMSANSRRTSGLAGASMTYSQNRTDITNGFVNGLFSAASSGAQSYYAQKPLSSSTSMSSSSAVQSSYGPYLPSQGGYQPAYRPSSSGGSGGAAGSSPLASWGV